MRGDPKLLLHCLEMQQKFKDVITPKEAQRRQLQAKSEQLYHELSEARSQIQQLEKDVASLKWERPDEYIRIKARVLEVVHYVVAKMKQFWNMLKNAVLRWYERRKTHPLY